jgi:viroplasmin and RNaseH domain-containing protein
MLYPKEASCETVYHLAYLQNGWDCSQHVTGFRGAIYQGCKTLEIAKNIIETAGLLPISVYNYEWIPIAIYFETHLPNTELSDEIDLNDGGSDTETENEELTTHSSNTGGGNW